YIVIRPESSDTRFFNVRIDDTSKFSLPLHAVTYFRGQETNSNSVRPPNASGVRIAYVPHADKDSSIMLGGDRKQRSLIDFILDCSFSMKEPTDIQSEAKGNSKKKERLDLAKEQLTTMLGELVERNKQSEDIHVGVRFFGHRVNWIDGIPKEG